MLNLPGEELPKCFTTHNAVFSTRNIIKVVQSSKPPVYQSPPKPSTPIESVSIQRKPIIQKKGLSFLSELSDCEGGLLEENVFTQQMAKEWILQHLSESSTESESEVVRCKICFFCIHFWSRWKQRAIKIIFGRCG